ncbi:MAG: hypothetical protein AAB554_02705 [Patescibacteria group bacterium]
MDEKMIRKLNTAISAVFIVAAAVLFSAALKNREKAETPFDSTSNAPSTAESATQAYDDLDGMKRLVLAADFASWTPGAEIDDEKVRGGSLAVSGRIAKAFLSVKASGDGKPLTKYESVFVKFNDAGGHLFRPQSLPTQAEDDATALLFDLGSMPVLPTVPYDETRTPDTADVTAVLKDGKTVKLTAFISSLRPALLEDLTLSYVCVEGGDCSISLR